MHVKLSIYIQLIVSWERVVIEINIEEGEKEKASDEVREEF